MKTMLKRIISLACLIAVSAATGSDAASLIVDPSAAQNTNGVFNIIQAALDSAKPGDTVLLRAGIYRGPLRVSSSGAAGKPITIAARPGARVIISGARPVTGWRRRHDGIYVAHVDFRPAALFVGARREPPAREPDEGWWLPVVADGDEITDIPHLKNITTSLDGAGIHVWKQRGTRYYTAPIAEFDHKTCQIRMQLKHDWMQMEKGDKYWIQNHPALIDQPGEWAVLPEGDGWNIFYLPSDPQFQKTIEVPFARNVVSIDNARHIILRGVEVTRGTGHGILIRNASDIDIGQCVARDNLQHGIAIKNSRNIRVRHNVACHNYCGVTVAYSHKILVEENEIAWNGMDGLLFTWHSSDLTARRNYIHHHLLWGHPDNTQFYRGVTNVKFIDNLLIAGGQSVMMEETTRGEYTGNMFIGSGAVMLIFGHNNAGGYVVRNNTLAFSGYACMALSWKDYDVAENVFMRGSRGPIYSTRNATGYRGDRNLFWNAAGISNSAVLVSCAGWHKTLSDFQKATGQDRHSIYANPRFINAPLHFSVIASKRITRCTRNTFYLRGGAADFAIGDNVEINFDGQPRRIVSTTPETITVNPPLDRKPIRPALIADWGTNVNFTLDLRLRGDSPGAHMSENGGPIGSTIDIQAFQRGDFNGDGKRDIPRLNCSADHQ